MILACQIIVVFLLVKSFELFLDAYYKKPPAQAEKAFMASVMPKKTAAERVTDELVSPFAVILEPLVRIPEAKEIKIQSELKRAGIRESPKMYYARAIAVTLLLTPLPVIVVILGINIFAIFSVLLLITVFLKQTGRHKERLKKKKDIIEKGLPGFIRAILYKLSESKEGVVKADLIAIFENYLKVANPAFTYDISVLIMEMKSKDIEAALRNFNNRLAIPEVTFLSNALIGITRGEHQNDALASLAREMDVKSKENIRKELDKRPKKVFFACIPLVCVAFIAIAYVLVIALMSGFSNFV